MNTGKVKFYNEAKGFGFIIDDNSKEDIFVHATGLYEKGSRLRQDDKVSFDTTEGKKGTNAVNVKVLN